MPVCHFKRAFFSKIFHGYAAYGYCASKDEKYYGFKGHLIVSLDGIITAFNVTPANVDEREAMLEMVQDIKGLIIGDKGYICQKLKGNLSQMGIDLQTPLRSNMEDDRNPRIVRLMTSVRRRVETVIGQPLNDSILKKYGQRPLASYSENYSQTFVSHSCCFYQSPSRSGTFAF